MIKLFDTIQALSEHNHYYLLEDNAQLELSPLADDQHPSEMFPFQASFNLLSELQQVESESKALLGILSAKDKDLGHYLRLQDKKINLIAQAISDSDQASKKTLLQSITLSEGGIVAKESAHYEAGDKLAIKLTLVPSNLGLLLSGKVLSSMKMDDVKVLHIQFMDISEAQQQLIARHIMRKQSDQRLKPNNR